MSFHFRCYIRLAPESWCNCSCCAIEVCLSLTCWLIHPLIVVRSIFTASVLFSAWHSAELFAAEMSSASSPVDTSVLSEATVWAPTLSAVVHTLPCWGYAKSDFCDIYDRECLQHARPLFPSLISRNIYRQFKVCVTINHTYSFSKNEKCDVERRLLRRYWSLPQGAELDNITPEGLPLDLKDSNSIESPWWNPRRKLCIAVAGLATLGAVAAVIFCVIAVTQFASNESNNAYAYFSRWYCFDYDCYSHYPRWYCYHD